MATLGDPVRRLSQIESMVAFDSRRQLEQTPGASDEWLHQASKARDSALRLFRDRCSKDLEAAKALDIDPGVVAAGERYAEKLTAEYLLESEKLFELIGRLARE